MAEVGVYAVYAPLFPYRLRDLGYNNVSSAAGYLASAYAGGLAIGSPAYSYIGNRFAKVSLCFTNRDAVTVLNVTDRD